MTIADSYLSLARLQPAPAPGDDIASRLRAEGFTPASAREAADSLGDVPLPTWQGPILSLLLELEYHPETLRPILAHLSRFGTAEGCRLVDPEHRERVEALVPGNPLHWPLWTDAERWVTR